MSCHYGCLTDSDCNDNQVCVCEDERYGGRCLEAGCRTNEDCGAGLRCAVAFSVCGIPEFRCETAADECILDSDCGEGDCYFLDSPGSGDGARACANAVCG